MQRFRDTDYFVSEDGSIFKGEKRIAQSKMTRGYLSVSLYYQGNSRGKTFYVHRVIAETFIPNPNNLPLVNHIDGDKHNNNVSNLEWCDYKHNSQHSVYSLQKEVGENHSRAKIPNKIVSYIRKCKIQGIIPNYKRLSETYGVGVQHLKNIHAGRKRLYT
jgi:hypothetical protein